MSSEPTQIEGTDLIDVSDVESKFNDNLDFEAASVEDSIGSISKAQDFAGSQIASFKDRAAAFFIDAVFLYVVYWLSLIIYRTIAYGQAAGPIPILGANGMVFHSLFLLLALLWFVIPEFALTASLGKRLCNLTVRKIDGSLAGFGSILVRNIFRFIDVILIPTIATFAIMEWGSSRRLGDLAGGTMVLKTLSTPPVRHALSTEMLASASGRAFAFLVDLLIVLAIVTGLALMLTPEEKLGSMLIVVFAPIVALFFYSLLEWGTKTSPGKWLLGYAICHEDGSLLTFSSALIRNLWKLVDSNPIGFLVCLFSIKKQRPGDQAAGTVVIKSSRDLKGLIGIVSAVIVASGIIYGGVLNRDSFLTTNFEVNFLPAFDLKGSSQLPAIQPNLSIKNFTFAEGEASYTQKSLSFRPGDKLFMLFEVNGYKKDGSRVWLEEDLLVRYPDDSVGLKLEKINEFNQEIHGAGPIRFENNIMIPQDAEPGRYTVTITVRDKISRQELKEPRFFYVLSREQPLPEEIAPNQNIPRPLPPQGAVEPIEQSPQPVSPSESANEPEPGY